MAAADVGDFGAGLELRLYAVKRRDPVVDQVRLIARAEEAVGPAEQALGMIAPWAPLAGLERLGRFFMPGELRNDQLEEALHARRLALAGEDQRLFGRDREGLVVGVMLDIARRTNRSEPFVEVFGVEAGLGGELVDRHRAWRRQAR